MRRPAVALLPALLGGLGTILVATPPVVLVPGSAPAHRLLFGVGGRGAIGQSATILVPGVARHRGFEVRLQTAPAAGAPAALTAVVNGGPPSSVHVPPHGAAVILVPPSTGAGLRLELRRMIPGPLVRVQRIVIRTPGSLAWAQAIVVAALAFVGTWLLLRRWSARAALALGCVSAGLLTLAAAPAVLFMMLPSAGALTRLAAPALLLVIGGILLCRTHRPEQPSALWAAVLIAGVVFGAWARASLILTSGSWDTEYWKAWMLRAESHGLARVYGESDAVEPGHLWAQVRRQEPRWEVEAFGRSFGVDYPPLAMASWRLSLAAARHLPGLDDRERLNVAAKLPALAGDVLACALLLWTLRRTPRRAATLATLYWALPMSWVSSAALGFMDGAYTPVLAAALVAAGLGRAGPAGALLALAALLKLTALVTVPAAAAALLAARRSLVPAAIGGACVVAVVFTPFLAAGTLNTALVHVYSILFQDRLSAGWANAWWMLGWAAALRGGNVQPHQQVPFVPISVLPLPAPALGGLLFCCAAAWVFWRQRRCPGPGPALLAGGALVLAYAGLATGVHENHPHPALFLLLATGLRTARLRWLTGAIALTYLLNLLSLSGLGRFYGLRLAMWPLVGQAAGRLRMVPGFDLTLVLAVANTTLLVWLLARLPADLAAHADPAAGSGEGGLSERFVADERLDPSGSTGFPGFRRRARGVELTRGSA